MSKNKKRSFFFFKVAIFLFPFTWGVILNPGQDIQSAQAAAKRTIASLMQDISNAQTAINSLYQQNLKIKTITKEIDQLNLQMNALKNQVGITQIESQLAGIQDQLNLGAVDIWANSIEPLTNTNLNRKVNDTLNAIYLNDPIIKDKMQKVSMLKKDITERISEKDWIKQIRSLGTYLNGIAANEIKQVNQAYSTLQNAYTQFASSKSSSYDRETSLLPLETLLKLKQLSLKAQVAQSPSAHKAILKYNIELKKIDLILSLMQEPSKASKITARSLDIG